MDKRAFGVLLIAAVVFGTPHLFGGENPASVADGDKAAQGKVFNIKNYGAIGDGVAMDTEAVQNTIDAYAEKGLDVYELILEKSFREKIASFYREF